ncbi:MAG: helix-turn-helix transcriptional regulator [Lentisphaerae bacterium]|nr:helix-turn-helix transcriptional regulator [Lentisphaerota bacterium]
MKYILHGRSNLISIFNGSHFTLRHYARGYYPTHPAGLSSMPVNRMFFPLKNPNGPENSISDSFRKYELIPGKMYFVPAFLPACFKLDTRLYFLSIQATLEIFPGVELFSGCPHMLELPAPPEFGPLMEIFEVQEPNVQYQNAVRAGGLVHAMLGRMVTYYQPEDFWKPLALRKYADLTDFLNANGNALTSVSDLAAQKKLSRENFTRHFTADTGITPKQLIDRFVTGRCLTLIEQGYSFKEIARRMRFRDEFAFSRYFKRNMGSSPRDWRNRWTGNRPRIGYQP